jgi:hypothetical protein
MSIYIGEKEEHKMTPLFTLEKEPIQGDFDWLLA